MVTLIPLLPFLAFWLIVFRGRRLPGEGAYVAVGALALSGLLSLVILGQVMFGGRYQASMVWAALGDRTLTVGYAVDPLSAVMLFVVTVVGSLIFVYSIGYMRGDPRYPRFFAYLSLFAASMLLLVLANNFLVLYAGWELVGLCSYLLIGFWFERPAAARAALKAFVTTRVGDFSMMIGLLILFLPTRTLSFTGVFHGIEAGQIGGPLLTLAAVLVFGGAVGKSAQVPLHVWLPDAMEGPTPVSALIHAATMVAAGVYLVARTFPLFQAVPQALTVVAVIGGFTAIFAATMGLVNNDIKRVLAYSTVSQLGYMMLALGALTVFLTAFYTFRMFFLTFHGAYRGAPTEVHHAQGETTDPHQGALHESDWWMIGPLVVLAIPALVVGFWGAPPPFGNNGFQ